MMMQGLNRTGLWWRMLDVDTETCKHQPVYFGVININIGGRTIGSVDVWRCAACKKKFCEEKQLGIEALADSVGMPTIRPDEKWAVCVCKLQKGQYRWKLVRLKESGELRHGCLDERVVSLNVKDYVVEDDNHWSFLVDDHVNTAAEI